MKSLLIASVALLALAAPASAFNNGNGNGNGNQGIFNGNFNGNGGGNRSGVGIGVGFGGQGGTAVSNAAAASAANASAQGGTASNSVTFKSQRQAPGIGVAGLAIGGLSCKGSASFGLSLPGGAGGFGFPVGDDECERRQWAGMLASAKDPRARALAWAIMARSPIVQQALQDTGYGAQPVAYGRPAAGPAYRGGNSRVTASGCQKWSGGSAGAGICVY